jgi:hypothetical protein
LPPRVDGGNGGLFAGRSRTHVNETRNGSFVARPLQTNLEPTPLMDQRIPPTDKCPLDCICSNPGRLGMNHHGVASSVDDEIKAKFRLWINGPTGNWTIINARAYKHEPKIAAHWPIRFITEWLDGQRQGVGSSVSYNLYIQDSGSRSTAPGLMISRTAACKIALERVSRCRCRPINAESTKRNSVRNDLVVEACTNCEVNTMARGMLLFHVVRSCGLRDGPAPRSGRAVWTKHLTFCRDVDCLRPSTENGRVVVDAFDVAMVHLLLGRLVRPVGSSRCHRTRFLPPRFGAGPHRHRRGLGCTAATTSRRRRRRAVDFGLRGA